MKFLKIIFENSFSQFLVFGFSVKEISSPSLEGDFFVTFDHMELTRFLINISALAGMLL